MPRLRTQVQVWITLLGLLTLAPAIAGAAASENSVLLFHAGSAQVLSKNVERRGISQDDWDRFIMPLKQGQTNFNLRPYRQGLYGAEQISEVGLYAFYKMQNGIEPQIMAIQVKPACFTPDKRFNSIYQTKPVTPSRPFSVWLDRNKVRFSALEAKCHSEHSVEPYHYWQQGELYSSEPLPANDPTAICTDVLQQFLVENDIKLVVDRVNDDSWYIRDRECIETILGTPDEFLQLVLENRIGKPADPAFRNFYGDSVAPGHVSAGLTFVFLRALSKTSLMTRQALPRLAEIEREVDAYLEGGMAVPHPSLDDNDHNYWFFRQALRAGMSAIESQTVERFQTRLSQALDAYLASTKDACSGRHGVAPEKLQGCHVKTVKESRMLFKILSE